MVGVGLHQRLERILPLELLAALIDDQLLESKSRKQAKNHHDKYPLKRGQNRVSERISVDEVGPLFQVELVRLLGRVHAHKGLAERQILDLDLGLNRV